MVFDDPALAFDAEVKRVSAQLAIPYHKAFAVVGCRDRSRRRH
jgi:hypothetical protein